MQPVTMPMTVKLRKADMPGEPSGVVRHEGAVAPIGVGGRVEARVRPVVDLPQEIAIGRLPLGQFAAGDDAAAVVLVHLPGGGGERGTGQLGPDLLEYLHEEL